uniref:CUB-like domain-containing protein n=1 Tax=Panagrolaimus davidi TaxID=227884 RepID=A0A914P6Z2_9BILA
MRTNDAFTVCAASGTLELYVSHTYYPGEDHPLDEYNLYDGDENGATLLGTLADGFQRSTSGCFTIFAPDFTKKLHSCASEAPEWQYFKIYTPGLTLIIPPSSKITIYFEDYQQTNTTGIIQKGIITSPSYNGFNSLFNTNSLYENCMPGVFHQVAFSFKEKYGNPKVVIQADDQNTTLVNDTTTIQLYGFSLMYEETNFTTNGFLIEYIIDKTPIEHLTTVDPISTEPSFFPTESFSTTPPQFQSSEIIPTTSISHSNKIEFALFASIAVQAFYIIMF